MRLHRNLVLAVNRIIDSVFNLESYADKTIEKVLRGNKKWGSRDRGFIAETSYEIIRWKRLYLKIAEVKKPYNNENLWRIFSVWAVLKGINLPDWKEFEKTPKRRIKGKWVDFCTYENQTLKITTNSQTLTINQTLTCYFP